VSRRKIIKRLSQICSTDPWGYGRIYLWMFGFGNLRSLESKSSSHRSHSEPPVPASAAGGMVLVRQAGKGGFDPEWSRP
jgi:hypothetical protein